MREAPIWPLIAVFVPLSLASVGGGPSIIAGIHHESIEIHNWVSPAEFVDLFAISRAAPGPGSMLATLIGWKIGGWLGAIVATLALYLPSSLVCFGVAKIWRRYRGRRWHSALQQGLAPVGTGLILAGIVAIFRVAGAGPLTWGVAAVSAVIMGLRPTIPPPLLFLVAAALFITIHWAEAGSP